MNNIVKNTLALTVITVALGSLLGIVHEVTLEPIEKQEQLAKDKAYREVFADADTFETIDLAKDNIEQSIQTAIADAGYTQETIDEACRAMGSDGSGLGYVLTVTTGEGYGGDIQFTLGISDQGEMMGLSFLSISETAGLGMRADTDEFKNQFKDRTTDQITATKDGASSDDEIDALSGATITTKAVTKGVNAGLAAFRVLEEGGARS